MSTLPRFLDQPTFKQRTPRVSQSMADYASPVTRYDGPSVPPIERAAGVVLAFVIGLLLAMALVHWWLA